MPDSEIVEETAWLPVAVGQVAALAGVRLPLAMIMPIDILTAASDPASARLRARGRVAEVMSRSFCVGAGVLRLTHM
ncbi:hypothetical protein JCM4814A_06420 [Streptomyces phaeofaciens JCM 4814]|uniref:Uncharacterized protein n=1 Tax=Streptomyces phaeofaciens TaxID=68254 RepID=A0A918HE35_9ACTN|nr:hypothetical protein GCM10010226_34090 [Streptomyces phaeofaciens]